MAKGRVTVSIGGRGTTIKTYKNGKLVKTQYRKNNNNYSWRSNSKAKQETTRQKITPKQIEQIKKTNQKIDPTLYRQLQRKKGLAGFSQGLGLKRAELASLDARGNLKPLQGFTLAGVTYLQALVNQGIAVKDLPRTINEIRKNPSLLKNIPSALRQELVNFNKLAEQSPDQAIGLAGAELTSLKVVGKGIKTVGKIKKGVSAKLPTKLGGDVKVGQKIKLPTGKGDKILEVVNKIPGEPLKSQVRRAGTKTTAITSLADEILPLLKKQRVIRKPIPGEETFTQGTKKLLNKFDSGKITKLELIKLDRAVRKQGAKGLLERSLFADPTGKIRPSRLGIEPKEAKLLDILTGDVSFKRSKPQILLFEDVKVQKLPKNLSNIKSKLSKGQALTEKEANALLKFQLKKSGKFKPVGFTSKESEITLAPGEMLKKVKKVSSVRIKGKKVPIIKTEVYKPTGRTKTLLSKLKKNKLTKKEKIELNKLLKKKTGFNYGLSSSKKISKKYLSLKRVGASLLTKVRKSRTPSSSKIGKSKSSVGGVSRGSTKRVGTSRYSPRKSKSKTSYGKGKRSTPYPGKYIPRGSSGSSYIKTPTGTSIPGKPGKPIVPIKPLLPLKSNKVKKHKKAREGYFVYEKRGKKFVRLNKVPLSKKDAKDKLAYRLDNYISRTAKIEPTAETKILADITRKERGYFRKTKKNLRVYKIKNKRKIKTPGIYIEKRGKGISTKGEKRQLKLNRRMKLSKSERARRSKQAIKNLKKKKGGK